MTKSTSPKLPAQGRPEHGHAREQELLAVAERLQQSLSSHANQFQLLIDHIPLLIYLRNREGHFLRVNEFFTETFGLNKYAALQAPITELAKHHPGLEALLQGDKPCFQSSTQRCPREVSLVDRHGIQRIFQAYKVRNVRYADDPHTLLCIAADITHYRHLELAQQIAGLGYWGWDVATGQLAWSEEIYRIFALDPARSQASYETFTCASQLSETYTCDYVYIGIFADAEKSRCRCMSKTSKPATSSASTAPWRSSSVTPERPLSAKTAQACSNRNWHAGMPNSNVRLSKTSPRSKSPACPCRPRPRACAKCICSSFRSSMPAVLCGFLGIATNISAQKQAEAELRLLASVFDNSIEEIMITDPEGTVLRVNQAFSDITGYSAHEAIGKTPRLLSSDRHSKAFYDNLWHEAAENGTWRGDELELHYQPQPVHSHRRGKRYYHSPGHLCTAPGLYAIAQLASGRPPLPAHGHQPLPAPVQRPRPGQQRALHPQGDLGQPASVGIRDHRIVQDIPHDTDDQIITGAIIAMAHSLRLRVIAEGVETRDQLHVLNAQGCDEIQGYLFSPPQAADVMLDLIRQEKNLYHE